MKEKVEFRKIREFGDVIGDTFLFIKQNFKPLMKCFFYLSGIFIIGGILSSILTQFQSGSAMEDMGNPWKRNSFAAIYALGFNYILVVLFAVLSYISMYVSVLSYVALYIQKGNEAPSVAEVWVYFKYYFFRLLGSGILMGIFLFLCFICCIIPGIYVFPAVTLFYVVMILENGNISHSFDRSFKLVKNEWWITAATLLIIYIIYYACSMIIQLPSIIILMISTFTNAEKSITKTYAIVSSVSQYASQVFMIIPIICSAFIYSNLVERKDNTGLLNRIDSLGEGNGSDNTVLEEY